MILLRHIVAASSSILLVLLSTPAGVEGTCKCREVCPNWVKQIPGYWDTCFINQKYCDSNNGGPLSGTQCDAYCACNLFGCKCDPCGTCSSTRRMVDAEEKEEDCADFDFFTSLSADGKRNSLAEKYCLEEDQIVREDIFEILLSFALSNYEGVVLSEV